MLYATVPRTVWFMRMGSGSFFLVPGATVATILMLGLLHARRLYEDKKVRSCITFEFLSFYLRYKGTQCAWGLSFEWFIRFVLFYVDELWHARDLLFSPLISSPREFFCVIGTNVDMKVFFYIDLFMDMARFSVAIYICFSFWRKSGSYKIIDRGDATHTEET